MDAAEFSKALKREGFLTVIEVEREPNGGLGRHGHPFQSKALILEGELSLVVGETETLYRAGDVFELSHDQPHAERYGPEGVKYLVGRK
jgi:quercetin dioxygenase-like cupin family protein